jgi:bifunctional non-homologous end joining protein LigD
VSHRDNPFRRFPSLNESLGNLPVKSAIFDGEIVCLDTEGNSLFNELLFRRSQPYFYAFDLSWLNGKDLRKLPLIERKVRLREVVREGANPALLYADHVDHYGIEFFCMVCEKNLEGIVAKHRASPYDSSAKWIKIKNPAYTRAEGRHELFESFHA